MHYTKVKDVNAKTISEGFGIEQKRMLEFGNIVTALVNQSEFPNWLAKIDRAIEISGAKTPEEIAMLMFAFGQFIGRHNAQEEAGGKIFKLIDVISLMASHIEKKGWEDEVNDIAATIQKTGVEEKIAKEIAQAKQVGSQIKAEMKGT